MIHIFIPHHLQWHGFLEYCSFFIVSATIFYDTGKESNHILGKNGHVKLKIVCNIETPLLSSRHAQQQISFYDILLRSLTN